VDECKPLIAGANESDLTSEAADATWDGTLTVLYHERVVWIRID
jgi:hypothetical protein